jgi:glycine/D-amino acid oxidase-like deaminating enzyme
MDVVIVGGGVIGCAAAYFLAREHGVPALVPERDPSWRSASSALSASSIRQQFSTPVNIALSQASLELMRPWRDQLRFVQAEVVAFDTAGGQVRAAIDAHGIRHPCAALLLAAGAWAAPLAACLGVDLPVRARKRDVFVLDSPASLPGCPLLIDPSGFWLRPEGRGFLAGMPPRDGDPDDVPLDAIDHAQFDAQLWPALAARIPAFEALRVRSAWAGYYETNTFDRNGLVGALPGWANAHAACGFSGHGMQHALAVGRGIASFVRHGRWADIDLTPLSPERLAQQRPLLETIVI